MKIKLIAIGKTAEPFIALGFNLYQQRIQKYTNFEYSEGVLPVATKKLPPDALKIKEGEWLLQQLTSSDLLCLLDESGKNFTSIQFANQLQNWQNRSIRTVIFAIGGAFGFSEAVYARANDQISLSKMTFSHQIIRIIFAEQLYRAYTILNNEPYHHA